MYISSSLYVYSVFNSRLVFNILHKMTGQSCAAVCVVLCVLAATARSFSFIEVPSAYDDDVPPAYDNDNGKCFIIIISDGYIFWDCSTNKSDMLVNVMVHCTCIQHQISYITHFLLFTVHIIITCSDFTAKLSTIASN